MQPDQISTPAISYLSMPKPARGVDTHWADAMWGGVGTVNLEHEQTPFRRHWDARRRFNRSHESGLSILPHRKFLILMIFHKFDIYPYFCLLYRFKPSGNMFDPNLSTVE